MKVNRSKQVRKVLRFFKMVYGIDDSRGYHVLLDGNFIFGALKFKVDIMERLCKLLQVFEVKVYVLKSVVAELSQVGAKAQSALDFARRVCEMVDDDHLRGDNATDKTVTLMRQQHQDWLASPAARKRRYLVATQDKDLRAILGHVPGIPLIYLNKVTMVLEPPSSVSKDFNLQIEASKTALRPAEADLVENISKKRKRRATPDAVTIVDGSTPLAASENNNDDDESDDDDDASEPDAAPVERKKHKAKAANPLSAMPASSDSGKQKKKKKDLYKR